MRRRSFCAIVVANMMMLMIGCTAHVAPELNNALPTESLTSAVVPTLPPTWTATARPHPTATAIATLTPTPVMTNDAQNAAATAVPIDLENFVAENVIHGDVSAEVDTSPKGAIVAYVGSDTSWSEVQSSVIKVWRYSLGKLTDTDPKALSTALGSIRSEWPLFTFVFVFESISPERATVKVYTFYDRGLSPDSRGGFAARWEFAKKPRGWTVLSHIPFSNWD